MKRVIFTFVILTAGASLLHSQPASPAPANPAQAQACSQLAALNAKEKSLLQGLNAQIKPLAEQRTAIVEQNEQLRYALRNQIVPGSGDALKAFDDQKKAAQLAISKMAPPPSPMSACRQGQTSKRQK